MELLGHLYGMNSSITIPSENGTHHVCYRQGVALPVTMHVDVIPRTLPILWILTDDMDAKSVILVLIYTFNSHDGVDKCRLASNMV
jgi:hypothetical protein